MTVPQTVKINSRKADGSVRRSWDAELLEMSGNELLFVGVFEYDVAHPELGRIRKGTVSYEYYWLDRWYNTFAFFEPEGGFRNYYCNICSPPTFEDGVLDYVDLEIDLVVWPGWQYAILDQDEYERNAELFSYSDLIRRNVAESLRELQSMIEAKDLPVRH